MIRLTLHNLPDDIQAQRILTSPVLTADQMALLTRLFESTSGQSVRVLTDPDTDSRAQGIARRICDERGMSLGVHADLRDGYLHLSGLSEYLLPVRQAMLAVRDGRLAID